MELMLAFSLGNEQYGLEVRHLQEIVERPMVHYVPRAPALLQGAINFHGSIVPVLDLAELLGFPRQETAPRLLVLTPEWCSLALAVHGLRRIVPMKPEHLLPLPAERRDEGYIHAAYALSGEIINLLDPARLLAGLQKFPLNPMTGGD